MALQGPRENGVLEEGGRQLVWTVGWAGAACREEEGCPIAEEARQVGGELVWETGHTWASLTRGGGWGTVAALGAVRPRARPLRQLPTALQDLEPQQLLLFVQSFGIPVSSMSKLLQYLDQAVAHDPQTLEQNIMDKSEQQAVPSTPGRGSKRTATSDAACGPREARGSVGAVGRRPRPGRAVTRGVPADYMAHLVEVQHERGASGGQTFHSLLTASLPARRGTHARPLRRPLPRVPLLLVGSVPHGPREPR